MQRLQTYQEDEQKLINFVKELSNYKEQLTIKDPVSVQGKAVFNSTPVTVTFKPATINHGIAFYKDGLRVDASIDNVVSTDMYITLGSKTPLNIEYLLSNVSNNLFMKAIDFSLKISHKLLGFYDPHQINIVEHILATIYGLGIDNLEIHLNNNQLPIFNDGSLEYIKAFQKAGVETQGAPKQYIELKDEIFITGTKEEFIIAIPSDKLEIDYTVVFREPIRKQHHHIIVTPESFLTELSEARTIAFTGIWSYLTHLFYPNNNFNHENILVAGRYLYENSPRYVKHGETTEIVRHKEKDLLGALALLKKPLKAKIIAYKSSHAVDFKLDRKINQNHKPL